MWLTSLSCRDDGVWDRRSAQEGEPGSPTLAWAQDFTIYTVESEISFIWSSQTPRGWQGFHREAKKKNETQRRALAVKASGHASSRQWTQPLHLLPLTPVSQPLYIPGWAPTRFMSRTWLRGESSPQSEVKVMKDESGVRGSWGEGIHQKGVWSGRFDQPSQLAKYNPKPHQWDDSGRMQVQAPGLGETRLVCDGHECHIVTDRIHRLLCSAWQDLASSGPILTSWQPQPLSPWVWQTLASLGWQAHSRPHPTPDTLRCQLGSTRLLREFYCLCSPSCNHQVRHRASALESPRLVWDPIVFLLGIQFRGWKMSLFWGIQPVLMLCLNLPWISLDFSPSAHRLNSYPLQGARAPPSSWIVFSIYCLCINYLPLPLALTPNPPSFVESRMFPFSSPSSCPEKLWLSFL